MLGQRLRQITGGAPFLPLGVLFGLNFVDEFDRIAFATLAPEIRDAFGLSDGGIGAIANIAAIFPLAAALPTGSLGDRFSRVRLALFSALLWGSMSVLTGLVPTVMLLVVVRILSGIGRNANEIIHPSLLTDLYPSDRHPRVFQVHRLANPASAVSGLAAGFIGSKLGWEWAFIILSIPTFFLLLGLGRVDEPPRGRSGRHETWSAMGLLEARRELATLTSLRRFWQAGFFLGAIQVPILTLLSLFFEDVYGYEEQARGIVQFLYGSGQVAGLFIGASVATRYMADLDYNGIARVSALGFAVIGVAVVGAVISPFGPLSVALTAIAGIGNGMYQPSYYTAVGAIAPPHLSSQAFAWGVMFFGIGGLSTIPVFVLGDTVSYRLALGSIAVFGFIAAAITRRAGEAIESDIERTTLLEAAVDDPWIDY